MSQAIDDLKHEHEAILFTIKVMERMSSLIEGGQLTDPGDPLSLVAFLKEFADKCHHGKEEGILFPALEKAGIAREGGPIGVMLAEHAQGRDRIKGMEAALKAKGGIDASAFAREAGGYAALLKAHIEKENTVLFPMGERVLDAGSLERIYSEFEEHEEKVIGAGRHQELHAMLDGFERKYLKAASA
jgi:hemerythrin-like domain-containing protein